MLAFIEERVNSSLAELVTSTGDLKERKKSHDWGDEEWWEREENYLGDNSVQVEEEEMVGWQDYLGHISVRVEEEEGEVCIGLSIWQEWTRAHHRRHGKVHRSSWRGTMSKKRRRRQEGRRRRALRRKKLARRARVGGHRRRPRTCFRGGANPPEGDQVCVMLLCSI